MAAPCPQRNKELQMQYKIQGEDALTHVPKKSHNLAQPLLVPPVVAGLAIGYQPQTTRNKMSQGKFPIQTVVVDGRPMVRVKDMFRFVDELPLKAMTQKKRRGAPTKAERLAKVVARTGKPSKGGEQ